MNTTLLYPPILPSSAIPFLGTNLELIFELSNLNALNEISGIEFFVYLVSNDKQILKGTIASDNFILYEKNKYKINIDLSDT